MKCLRLVLTCSVCCVLGWPGASLGQVQHVQLRTVDRAGTLEQGVRALEARQTEAAIRRLRGVFRQDPAFFAPPHGAVAYWLGRAYEAAEQPGAAYRTWQEGLDARSRQGILDVQMGDAFLQGVFEQQDRAHYAAAAGVYLQMLGALDLDLSAEQRALINRHLAPLAQILPADVLRQTGLDAAPHDPEPETLSEGAGTLLQTWWRAQDPLPATPRNERLEEHLERTAHARYHYARDGRLDDRGLVYVRLGPPHKQTSVGFDGLRFRNKVLRRNPTLTSFEFPGNEFWVYRHVDRDLFYLFVEDRQDVYRIGAPDDLIPSTLRSHRRAEALIWTMEEVYRPLALYHESYGTYYAEIATYADLLDIQEVVGGANLPSAPFVFAQSALLRGEAEEHQRVRRREDAAPRTHTNLFEDAEPLPVQVRLARFLDPDGTTRAELYWGTAAEALRPARRTLKRLDLERDALSDTYLLNVAIAHERAGYRERTVEQKQHLVEVAPDEDAPAEAAGQGRHDVTAPQTYTVRGAADTFHVAVQWDQYVTFARGERRGTIRPGPRIKRNTFRADTLHALQSDEGTLEMSDLKPLLAEDAGPELEAAAPYPFAGIAPDAPLALYFEVYHLSFDADDRTRYAVEYEVARTRRAGSLLRRREQTDRTAAKTTYEGQSRTAQEYIALDLSDWDGEGDLVITVRVTDEVTGQQIERAVRFELIEEEES